MSKSGTRNNEVDYEINESLDELVKKDSALNRHYKGGNQTKTGGNNGGRTEDRDF